MRFVVIAEHDVQRAGRMEARTLGFVDADSLAQARRLAEATFPGLTLTVSKQTEPPPCTPRERRRD
jgi:hypothetical protein